MTDAELVDMDRNTVRKKYPNAKCLTGLRFYTVWSHTRRDGKRRILGHGLTVATAWHNAALKVSLEK